MGQPRQCRAGATAPGPWPAANRAAVTAALIGEARLAVESPQRIHDLVEAYRRAARSRAQRRSRLHRAGVGGPRGEDCPLLVERQVGIVDDVGGTFKGLRRMQKFIEIESIA
jgi:hypothetical protein